MVEPRDGARIVLGLLDEEDDRSDVRETFSRPRRRADQDERLSGKDRENRQRCRHRRQRHIDTQLDGLGLELPVFAGTEDRDVDTRATLLAGDTPAARLPALSFRASTALGRTDLERHRPVRLKAEDESLHGHDAHEGDEHDAEPDGQGSEAAAQHDPILAPSDRHWQDWSSGGYFWPFRSHATTTLLPEERFAGSRSGIEEEGLEGLPVSSQPESEGTC